MILLRKIAKWYLFLLCGFYIFLGILAIVNLAIDFIFSSNVQTGIRDFISTPFLVSGLLGPYVILLPAQLLYSPTFLDPPALIPIGLACIAIILGVLGIRAANHLFKRLGGSGALSLVIAISIGVTLYNLANVGKCYGELFRLCTEPAFIVTGCIQSLLMILSVILLKKNVQINPTDKVVVNTF